MKRTTAIVNLSTILMLSAVMITANGVASKFGGLIDLHFSQNVTDYDSKEVKEVLTQGKALAQEMIEDGQVLLKNQDNCLPLHAPKINIFGWGGCDNGFLYQGGGSSAGGYDADKISLYQAFRNTGFEINEDLAKAYNDLPYRHEGAADSNQFSTYFRICEPGEDFYTAERMNAAKAFSDTAVIVFSRRATEGDDLPKVQYDENGNQISDHPYLSLSPKEGLMISQVTSNFDKVICLFNTSAPMEMGFLDYPGIDAALSVGYPGYYGTPGICGALTGEINPSGHMVDTTAYDLSSAPSFVNAGNEESHTYAQRGGRYTDYAEDIYVGYKWYETADSEHYWDDMSLNSYGVEKHGYDAVVQYPFGYGLSYTTFDWMMDGITLKDGTAVGTNTVIPADDTLTFKVWVQNTGNVKGRDVVELYYNPPYTKGGVEKASQNLIDFQKTAILEPGKGVELTLTAKVTDLASYDTYDRNNNGFMGYELEEGNYTFSLRTDSHHEKEMKDGSVTVQVPKDGYQIEKDPVTGEKVTNQFTTYTNPVSGASSKINEPQATYAISIDGKDSNEAYDQGITYLSRSDFAGTFPKHTPIRTMNSLMFKNVFSIHEPTINSSDVMPTTGADNGLTLADVKGLPYDDPKWQKLVEELTPKEMAKFCAHGGFGTDAIYTIDKPRTTDLDGGTGFTSVIATGDGGHATKYPAAFMVAQSWDWYKGYKWGTAIGSEAKALNIQGWYAPGCNVHRSPLGGRNFEYFSEDGRMCGIFDAWTVKGCTENGVYAYMKHFAANDSDAGRGGQFKWMTEQSLREIWAKPGEIATKIGGANAAMASVDRIGSVRTTGSYALLTTLLRKEWGFRGSVISDYYQGGNINDIDESIRAGDDLSLTPYGTADMFDDQTSASTVIALQNAVHNILFTYIDTIHRTETAKGITIDYNTGTRQSVNNGTWWRPTLIAIDCVLGVGFLAWAGLVIWFTWFRKPKDHPSKKEEK
jgi:beta-glucosidase